MMGLAQAIGLSYADIVDITAWSLILVMLGVFFGKVLYDFYESFSDFCGLLLGRLFAFIVHFWKTLSERSENENKDKT